MNFLKIRQGGKLFDGLIQLSNKRGVNFASTQNIPRFPRHATGIFTHPLQIVWIVSASFKLASVPRPKAFALSAEHLIAAFGFVNRDLAVGAWFGVNLEKGNRSDRVRIANMVRIIAIGLQFPAMRTSVLVTSERFDAIDKSQLPKGVIGLHFDLTFGKAISIGGKSIITDENGNFNKSFAQIMLLCVIKKKEMQALISKEIKAQLQKLKEMFGIISHIDGHQHIHMNPLIFREVTNSFSA
jgi:hypothetical protein